MDQHTVGMKNPGSCREVAISGSTVQHKLLPKAHRHAPCQVVRSLHPFSFLQTQQLLTAAELQATAINQGCDFN